MKRILYLVLILTAISGCDRFEKDVFDNTAAERMQETIDQTNDALLGNTKGWILQYFPQSSEMGGYNLLLRFNENGTADTYTGEDIYQFPVDLKESNGAYEVIAEQSVLLTFNTFNEVLHYFVWLHGFKLQGDYEFLIKGVGTDAVDLVGKKYRHKSWLKPLPEGYDVSSFREKIKEVTADVEYVGYKLKIDGSEDIAVQTDYVFHRLGFTSGGSSIVCPYIYTLDGISLYEPVTVGGETFRDFKLNETGLVSVDNPKVSIEKFIPDNTDVFLNGLAWYFNPADDKMSASFKTVWDAHYGTDLLDEDYYYFGKDSEGVQNLFSGQYWKSVKTIYTVNLISYFTPVAGTTDVINLKYSGNFIGSEGAYSNCKYTEIIKAFYGDAGLPDYKGRDYVITLDNGLSPNEITMTDKNDPDYWFKLSVFKPSLR